MAYDTSRFYILSEIFDDDLGVMAHTASDNTKNTETTHKDLIHGRHKKEYNENLIKWIKKRIKPHIAKIKDTMACKGGIWARDDFENIEAYSVFKDADRKKAIPKKRKSKPSEYEQLTLGF